MILASADVVASKTCRQCNTFLKRIRCSSGIFRPRFVLLSVKPVSRRKFELLLRQTLESSNGQGASLSMIPCRWSLRKDVQVAHVPTSSRYLSADFRQCYIRPLLPFLSNSPSWHVGKPYSASKNCTFIGHWHHGLFGHVYRSVRVCSE